MFNALILAGADNKGALSQVSSEPFEATIQINGRPMIDYVLRAVLGSRKIDRVAVVGPAEPLRRVLAYSLAGSPHAESLNSGRVFIVERGKSLLENVDRGTATLGSDHKILFVTGDLPLLTTEAVDDFLGKCDSEPDAAFYYSIIARKTNDFRFPHMKRTYARLKDGVFTGGNIMAADPAAMVKCRVLLHGAVETRKKPWRTCLLLGPVCTVRFFLGTLTVAAVEARVQRMIGMKAVAIESPYAEIAVDVDKPSHLALVKSVLESPA